MFYDVKAQVNKEKYWELRDEHGELLDDAPGMTQKLYRAVCTECPFAHLSGCSDQSFERAKKSWWSLASKENVASYVKNHGMMSALHGRHADLPLEEEAIDGCLMNLEVSEEEQDYDTRMSYKETIERIEAQKLKEKEKEAQERADYDSWGSSSQVWKRQKADKGKSWSSSSWQSAANSWQREQAEQQDNDLAPSKIDKLTDVVQSMVQMQANSQAQQLMPPGMPLLDAVVPASKPPAWAPQAIDHATAPVWDPSMQMSVQEQTISMSYAQLLLYRESIDRAREAARASMMSCIENLTKLKSEVTILNNASVVLDDILLKGKQGR